MPHWPKCNDAENFFSHSQTLMCPVRWLHKLGSQLAMLQRIVIDLQTLRVQEWDYGTDRPGRTIDLLPLVRFFWSQTYHTPEVILVETHRVDAKSLYHGSEFIGYHKFSDAERTLKEIFDQLCRDDLRIKEHALLLSSIAVCFYKEQGLITYHTAQLGSDQYRATDRYFPCTETRRTFYIDHNDRLVFDKQPSPGLLSLPRPLKTRIFQQVSQAPNGIFVDLGKKDYPGLWKDTALGLLYASRKLRNCATFAWDHEFTLKMTSSTPRTSFHQFQSLRKWLTAGSRFDAWDHAFHNLRIFHGRLFPTGGTAMTRLHCMRTLSFHLHINTAEDIKKSHVRISIMDFIYVTSHIRSTGHAGFGRRIPTVYVFLSRDQDDDREENVVKIGEFNLKQLRKRVARALCRILLEHPLLWDAPCPEIFIDGTGQPKEFCVPGSNEMQRIPIRSRISNTEYLGPKDPFTGLTRHYLSYLWRAQSGAYSSENARACKSSTQSGKRVTG